MSEREIVTCGLCGEPMPPGEEMFNYHGYSGPCPKPPALAAEDESDEGAARPEGSGDSWAPPLRRPVPLATPQTETLLDVPHAEVDALVEAIYAERRALSPPPDVDRLTRPETGPMQFGDDWPGVFVRGDNAGGIVATLMSVVALVEQTRPMEAVQLRSIMRLFDSSDVRKKPEVQRAVLLSSTPGEPR